MLQSDVHRVKSSKGRKGSDPFDPPETIVDTNWLAAYNQFKAKQLLFANIYIWYVTYHIQVVKYSQPYQLHVKKESRSGRGGGRGGGNQQRGRGGAGNRGGYNHGNRGHSRGRGGNFGRGAFHGGYNGPPQRFNGRIVILWLILKFIYRSPTRSWLIWRSNASWWSSDATFQQWLRSKSW